MKNLQLISRIISCILMICMLAFISCGRAAEKSTEKSMEKVLEQGGGDSEVDLDEGTVKLESEGYTQQLNLKGSEWSAEIPSEVPEFKYGKIHHTTNSQGQDFKSWGIFYEDIEAGAMDKYEDDLKKKGFKTHKMVVAKGGQLSAEKDKVSVNLILSEEICQVSVMVRE